LLALQKKRKREQTNLNNTTATTTDNLNNLDTSVFNQDVILNVVNDFSYDNIEQLVNN